jgi:thioesterase domain-containing protein
LQQKCYFIMTDDLRRLEAFLHEKIPLTRTMGARVVADPSGFTIEAPVALNYNHLQTAFGGSINAVATLAGYAFLWLRIDDEHTHVVVRESSIRFVRPIHEMIRARCEQPPTAELNAFDIALQSKGKARLQLRVIVKEEAIAAEFVGTFVATRDA